MTLLYTVPALRTAVVRSAYLANIAVVAGSANLRINSALTAGLFFVSAIPAAASVAVPDDIILNPGDQLYGGCGVGGTVQFVMFGSLLDGAPS